MEKFKKLNRAEMKTITGGAPLCQCGQIVMCDCGEGPRCAIVDEDCDTGITAFGYCEDIGCSATSVGCFNDCSI